MKTLSDIIEEFILEQLMISNEINLSRNELADFFNCAPSQINYVLTTRFTNLRGYDVESRRGSGGFIRIYKIDVDENNISKYIHSIIVNVIEDEISETSAQQILENLFDRLIINEDEYNVLKCVISNKSLASPTKMANFTRANILKNVLLNIIKEI